MCQFNENTGGQKTAETFIDQNTYTGEFFFFRKKDFTLQNKKREKNPYSCLFLKNLLYSCSHLSVAREPFGTPGVQWRRSSSQVSSCLLYV